MLIMNMWDIFFSVVAIVVGVLLIICRERFIKGNSRAFWKLYTRTQFPLFKNQAESMDSTYMRMITVVVATFFIVAGIFALAEMAAL